MNETRILLLAFAVVLAYLGVLAGLLYLASRMGAL